MNENQPEPLTGSTTLLEEQTQNVEPGDHERFSHFVKKEKIVESAVLGTPVVALCGEVSGLPNVQRDLRIYAESR